MDGGGTRPVATAMTLSLGAHALGALLSILVPVVVPHAPRAAPEGEITLIVDEGLVAPTREREEEEEAREAPPLPRPVQARRPGAASRPPSATIEEPRITATATVISPAIEPTPTPAEPVESRAARAARLRAALDPGAVARSSFEPDLGSGPSQRRGPQRDVRVDPGPGAMGEAEAEQLHGGHLRAQAMAPVADAHAALRARPRPDGTYVYSGHAFTAVIHPDGTVRYGDRGAVEGDFLTGGGEWRIDANDLLMRAAGGDPYAAERLQFEEDNEELITRLAREHWQTRMADALRELPGEIARVWSGGGTPAQRRRRIFVRWCEVDEGEAGDRARGVIEGWVRAHLPAESEHAFTAAELAALNAGLAVRFAPYE